MTLSISLSGEAESRLRQRAAAAGQEPTAYAAQLLEQAIGHSALDELLAPLRAEFAASGNSDEQLLAQIDEARRAYRGRP